MMTDKLLKGLVVQAANLGKTELRFRHQLNGILAIYMEGQGLHRMRKMERLIEEQCGEDWMNSGRAKAVLGEVLRTATSLAPPGVGQPDAIVVVSVIDKYVQTPALDALPREERQRIATHDHKNPLYFEAHDALMAMAQTPDRVCIYTQKLLRHLLIGEPEVHFFDQSNFEGRFKLYGVEPSPDLRRRMEDFIKLKYKPS